MNSYQENIVYKNSGKIAVLETITRLIADNPTLSGKELNDVIEKIYENEESLQCVWY